MVSLASEPFVLSSLLSGRIKRCGSGDANDFILALSRSEGRAFRPTGALGGMLHIPVWRQLIKWMKSAKN